MSEVSERYLKAFCKNFMDLLEDLIRIFPEQVDFRMFQMGLRMISEREPQFIMSQFIDNVMQYREKIVSKDESFFLDDRSNSIESQVQNKAGAGMVEKVLNLKSLWKDKLSEENKDIIWKYMQVLVLLAEKWQESVRG